MKKTLTGILFGSLAGIIAIGNFNWLAGTLQFNSNLYNDFDLRIDIRHRYRKNHKRIMMLIRETIYKSS